MHRLIVTSSTYRQTSGTSAESLERDPDGSLLSRMRLRRMEAEVVRDSLLNVAGLLGGSAFGPADPIAERGDGLVTSKATDQGWRRSVYVLQRRTKIPTLFESFDFPQMGPNCSRRGESIVAPQALHLLNNELVHDWAVHFAERVSSEVGSDPEMQVERVHWIALGQPPNQQARKVSAKILAELTREWQREAERDGKDSGNAGQQALVNYCHAVMNSAAFVYVD